MVILHEQKAHVVSSFSRLIVKTHPLCTFVAMSSPYVSMMALAITMLSVSVSSQSFNISFYTDNACTTPSTVVTPSLYNLTYIDPCSINENLTAPTVYGSCLVNPAYNPSSSIVTGYYYCNPQRALFVSQYYGANCSAPFTQTFGFNFGAANASQCVRGTYVNGGSTGNLYAVYTCPVCMPPPSSSTGSNNNADSQLSLSCWIMLISSLVTVSVSVVLQDIFAY